jgi:hypothetical protein
MRTLFSALAGFVGGTYLDAFVRRYRGAQPIVRTWFDPLDAMERFAIDGEVRNARNNARETQDRLKLEYDATKRKLDALIGKVPFGYSGGIINPGPSSPEIDEARNQLAELRTALTVSGEPILKAEREIIDELISQLKRGVLTAKGFRVHGDQIAEEQVIIPASHWQLLNFGPYDVKRQSVGGGGKQYTGLQIGLNENRR